MVLCRGNKNVRIRSGFLIATFITGWGAISVAAIWQIQGRTSDSDLALTSGILLGASLFLSRCALGLTFTSGAMLYLGLFGLFHLGLVVPWALGVYDIARMPFFAPYGLSRAIELITYSIVSYQLGMIIASGSGPHTEKSFSADASNLEDPKIFLAGSVLFLGAVIAFVAGLVHLDPSGYHRLTYSDFFRLRAESDPRLFGSGITIAAIGLCLAAAGASKEWIRITLLGACFWVLMLFYLGFRGPALIAGVVVYTVAQRKRVNFPKWLPWATAAVLLIAIPIMRIAREEPLDERSLNVSLNGFNVLDGPAEMGASIRPLIEITGLVGPKNYRYGKTYLSALKGIVPNLTLRWESPATESIDDLPPSHWLIAVVDPWTYRNNGGMGFSAVAEPYMNFGIAGVIGYFFLVGYLLVRLDRVSIQSSYALACWALLLGPLLWTTRNDFANFFRPAVWGLCCLGMIWLVSRGYNSTTSPTSGRTLQIQGKVGGARRI
jgi:oligosaccharide repeat unit polymerase